MKTALSIRLMRLLNNCLPTREQGGIDSENPDIKNGVVVNARDVCTDDGVTCNECRSWRRYEANAIGAALCILSKCVKHYGGQTVAINVSGVSVNTHYIFEYLRKHGRFDGLCENGTHISKLGCRCKSWTKSHQCNMASSTLAAIDKAFESSFEHIRFEPSVTFLQMGLQNHLFKYVTKDGNVTTFAETCADCGVCDATVVDMLQMESSTVNESSFNEGQDEEEDDDHECSDDGDNIACCMVCDKCAKARVDEYDDEGNFIPISEFRQESKRAASRKYSAARLAKLKEDPEKWEKHLAAKRERSAAWYAKLKEEDPEKWEKHLAARRERDAARRAKLEEEDPEKWEKHKAARREREAARRAKLKEEDPEKLAAQRERRAKRKEERIVNSLLHEAHLHGALKQVLGDDTGADKMHKMLEDHASSLPTVQTPLISLPTFRSWWNDFESRDKPFDRRKEGLIQAMISFCKSWGVTVVKLTKGDHGLEFSQLHERVIVSEVRLDSPFAGKVSIDDQVVSIDANDVKQMSAEDIIQLLLSEGNRPMYVTFVDNELLEKKLNLSNEKEANRQPRSQPTHLRDHIYTAAVPVVPGEGLLLKIANGGEGHVVFNGYRRRKSDGSPGPAETDMLLRSRGDTIIAVNGRPIVDEHFRPSYSFGEVLQLLVHAVSPPSLKVHLTLVSPLSEHDVYLQQVLWEDGDFVRAVEATHQQEKVKVECEGLEQQSNQKQKKRTAKSTKSAANTKRLVSALSDAAPEQVKKKKVKLTKLVISDNKIGVRETRARVVSPAELDSVEEDNTNNEPTLRATLKVKPTAQ
eukprot:scaffold16649_cov79-Skeletonema_dohrnii-CCMP3373.AAC.3